MPPKKNGKKSSIKKKKKQTKNEQQQQQQIKTEWDDLDITALQDIVAKLSNDLQSSSKQRIQKQTEYEAIQQSYYEATKQNVERLQLKIKTKEMEIEDMIYDQNAEIQAYEEKEKYIKHDHGRNLKNVENEATHMMKVENNNHELKMSQNEKNEMALKMEIKERGIVHLQEVQNFKGMLEKHLDEVYLKLKEQIKKLEEGCKNEERQMNEDLDLKCQVELREMTERNNLHLHEIDRRHREIFEETKDYYEAIFNENKARVENLTCDLEKMISLILKYENETKRLEEENKELSDPLATYLTTVKTMKLHIKDKEKDKQASTSVKSRIIVVEERIQQVLNKVEALRKNYDALNIEVEEMKQVISNETSEEDLEVLISSKIRSTLNSISSLICKMGGRFVNAEKIANKGGKLTKECCSVNDFEEDHEAVALELKNQLDNLIKGTGCTNNYDN